MLCYVMLHVSRACQLHLKGTMSVAELVHSQLGVLYSNSHYTLLRIYLHM